MSRKLRHIYSICERFKIINERINFYNQHRYYRTSKSPYLFRHPRKKSIPKNLHTQNILIHRSIHSIWTTRHRTKAFKTAIFEIKKEATLFWLGSKGGGRKLIFQKAIPFNKKLVVADESCHLFQLSVVARCSFLRQLLFSSSSGRGFMNKWKDFLSNRDYFFFAKSGFFFLYVKEKLVCFLFWMAYLRCFLLRIIKWNLCMNSNT